MGEFSITNNSNQLFPGGEVLFALQYGPFNPGGPEVGLSIDNSLTQSANFRSTINSYDFNPSLDVSSIVSCGIGADGSFGQVFSPTTCGLGAPDESIAQLDLLPNLDPGQSEEVHVAIHIDANFDLPEPSTLTMVIIPALIISIVSCARSRQNHRISPL